MTAVDGYRLGKSGISGMMLCAREHLVNLEESSMQEVKEAIRAVPWLDNYYDIGEKYIRSKDRRIYYAFTGLRHNLQGVKSKARILRAWVDEAEHVSDAGWRLLIPTVRDQDASAEQWWESEIWATWNPESEESSTHKRFRVDPPERSKIVELNWQDNPWFPRVLNEERLEDQRKRPETYDHVWEGHFHTITEAQVFKGKFETAEFEVQDDWDGPYNGLDFGFSQDPAAASSSYIHKNVLYIRHEMWQKGLEIDNMAQTLAREIPRIAFYVIRADSSRPDTISYLARHGLPRVVGANKGSKTNKGSIADGVEYLKNFDRIVIHPECPQTAREFRLYSYKMDRLSGDILPEIVDANNHIIDGLRYAHEPMIKLRSRPRIRAV